VTATAGKADVAVECRREAAGWSCRVTVSDTRGTTAHEVALSAAELTRYAPNDSDPERLVRDAFAFLLAREPKESILPRFTLSEIERYFPEFGRMIPS
jgi:hypothetical protein